jgi:hypothetical protein
MSIFFWRVFNDSACHCGVLSGEIDNSFLSFREDISRRKIAKWSALRIAIEVAGVSGNHSSFSLSRSPSKSHHFPSFS